MRYYGNTRKPEDVNRCAVEVYCDWQCKRPRGHGKDGLMCKQHAKYAYRGGYHIPTDIR